MDERSLPRRKRRLYHIFYGMKARCFNTKSPLYQRYGARGIKVCDLWANDYGTFEEWSYNNGYQSDLTIDRIDPSKDYCPENCRWISLSENSGRANIGIHKNKSKLEDPIAISPNGDVVHITNILKFAMEHDLHYITVVAALHGRAKYLGSGWTFISNKTKQYESVTTIERILLEKNQKE